MKQKMYVIDFRMDGMRLPEMDYKPTGKYRIYENGYMTIEFEIRIEQEYFWKESTYTTKRIWVKEDDIKFSMPYKEIQCEKTP